MASFCRAFVEIAKLHKRLGLMALNRFAACWEIAINDEWWIAVNGHKSSVLCSRGTLVGPHSAMITYRGFPAGVITPWGGDLIDLKGANEQTFIDAVRAYSPAARVS